jgi:glycosyltransferase involved in cell wall biosynthesis
MKVLHLRASNFYGGPERQLHMHAHIARQAGITVVIGSFSEHAEPPEFLEVISADGLETLLIPVSNAYDRSAVQKVGDALVSGKFDILCTHDYRTHVIGWLAARRAKVKWIGFSRGWTQDTFRVKVYTLIDKFVIRFADRIVAVSHSQKERLVRLWISPQKIAVVHNAIELDRFSGIAPASLKQRFNFPSDSIVIVAGGRFSQEKGQRDLVDAAARAIRKNPRIRVVMFGHGPDFDLILSQIRALGLQDSILCPGHERNLLGYLKSADMLVNPSLSEGLPNIILEAMALGVPVVATAVGGVPELIQHESNGLLVPAKDPIELSDAILQMAGAAETRSKFRDAAFETLARSFTFKGQLDSLSDLYQRVISEK